MSEKNGQKRIPTKLLHIAAAVSAAVLLAVGGITAYLTDLDVQRNVITLGSVKAELDEGNYTDEQTVVPGQIIEKAPKLTNTGKNDAYVFLRIEVPKAEVTLLYEEDTTDSDNKQHKAGEIRLSKSRQQIFRLLTDGAADSTAVISADADKGVSITYHGKTDTDDGWVLLTNECVFSDNDKDVYVFGYSKKLSPDSPNDETKPLFDSVQLKSIIDHELNDTDLMKEMQITVQGYAIQDRNLHIDGMDDGKENPTAEQLTSIYEIVQRKAAQDNGS